MDMKIVLANAFSVNMLEGPGQFKFARVEPGELVAQFGPITRNTIGHADIENLAGIELARHGVEAPTAQRSTFRFTKDVILLIAQYRGPRLDAGTTELPAGAVLEWWAVMHDPGCENSEICDTFLRSDIEEKFNDCMEGA